MNPMEQAQLITDFTSGLPIVFKNKETEDWTRLVDPGHQFNFKDHFYEVDNIYVKSEKQRLAINAAILDAIAHLEVSKWEGWPGSLSITGNIMRALNTLKKEDDV